jgi:hypothetical protein
MGASRKQRWLRAFHAILHARGEHPPYDKEAALRLRMIDLGPDAAVARYIRTHKEERL